jgi:hypothetical protein
LQRVQKKSSAHEQNLEFQPKVRSSERESAATPRVRKRKAKRSTQAREIQKKVSRKQKREEEVNEALEASRELASSMLVESEKTPVGTDIPAQTFAAFSERFPLSPVPEEHDFESFPDLSKSRVSGGNFVPLLTPVQEEDQLTPAGVNDNVDGQLRPGYFKPVQAYTKRPKYQLPVFNVSFDESEREYNRASIPSDQNTSALQP